MSGGMPELGSKISLISKADIRYEGRLYTVDPQECTIALSSVRSFGTEDRDTQFQIAPQSQIYDYILFRGTDIKDIRVINNSLPHPNDPAIMQVQLPNGQHVMPHLSMPGMNPQQVPPMGGVGSYGNPFGAMGGLGAIGGAGGGVPPSLAPGAGAPGPFMLGNQQAPPQPKIPQQNQQSQQSQQQQQQKQPISVIDMLAGASRSTTPISLISRKSPSADIGVQVNQQQQQQQSNQHHHQNHHHKNQNTQPQQQQNHHPNQHQNNAGHHGGQSRDAGHKRPNYQNQRNGGGAGGVGGNNPRNNNASNNPRDRRDSGRMMDNNNYHSNNNHDGGNRNSYNQQRGNNQGNQNRNNWNMHRGNMPNNMRNRGMRNQVGFRSTSGPGGMQKASRNPIKFEQDFDFEQANNKFEELRSQLSKLKVGDEPKSEQCSSPTPTTSQMNGETDKKDDSGNETGAGEHEPEEEEISVGYDKTKSFFDNISCETAQDRAKNKNYDWRQERKLNSETFGVSSTRRGGYRGRGNSYYNRNIGNYNGGNGGGGGGGYNRGYRGGNNYRNRSNNRTKIHNNRDGSNSNGVGMNNASTTNNNSPHNNARSNNSNAATNLKNQAQHPSTPGSGTSANASSAASTSKTASSGIQEAKQPQMAAVGAGK